MEIPPLQSQCLLAIHFRDVEMAECFKTGPCIWGYIMAPQVICLYMQGGAESGR